MFDNSIIEQFDKIATPFYYYDMELLHKTVDHVAELAQKFDEKGKEMGMSIRLQREEIFQAMHRV